MATIRKKWFKCPDCNYKHTRPQQLGVHRRLTHGVLGTSASSISKYKHEGKEEKTSVAKLEAPATKSAPLTAPKGKRGKVLKVKAGEVITPTKAGIYRCPECNKPFKAGGLLGIHRRFIHGVIGAKKLKSSSENSFECPDCEAKMPTARALAVHRGRMHKDISASNGHDATVPQPSKGAHLNGSNTAIVTTAGTTPGQGDPHDHPDEINLALIAHTVGKIEGLVEVAARQNDLPYRFLAQRCAEYFRISTRR